MPYSNGNINHMEHWNIQMGWLQLLLETDPDGAERLSELLENQGAASVTLQDAGDEPLYEPPPDTTPLWGATRVVALFSDDIDIDRLLRELEAAFAPQPLPPRRIEPLAEQDWSRAWMDRFRPTRFGRRLWIVPSWHEPPEPEAVNVLLDPGIAFGTGTHPTTRLCLEWLDGHVTPGMRVIDYGCGSGILAVAAARLGAAQVWAVDTDPQAVAATRDNATRNGVGDRIEATLPEAVFNGCADLLVANILANPLIALAPKLSGLVCPGGVVALSGILPEQADAVANAYAPAFDLAAPVVQDGWVRVSGIRKPDPVTL